MQKQKRKRNLYDQQTANSNAFLSGMRNRTNALLTNYPTNGIQPYRYGKGGPIVTAPLSYSKTINADKNEKKNGSNKLNSSWIRKQIPDALEQFTDHISGSIDSVKNVDSNLQAEYRRIINNKKSDLLRYGKVKIGYNDYEKNYIPNTNDKTGLENDYVSSKWNAANLTGSATLKKEGKNVVLEDEYNFNEPALKDNASDLDRFVGFITDNNPNPKLSKKVQNSFKQRAERYYGRSKGSPVKLTFDNVYK